ncbi:ion channel [Leifsonia poae]|uniref:ion channel n=1 Tax=Leifsonia poae TaxID=110933 RepID=UPI003D6702FE
MTTTGYGNLVPVTSGVQSVAIAEAITGQLFLVTAIARVVTGWTGRLRRPSR